MKQEQKREWKGEVRRGREELIKFCRGWVDFASKPLLDKSTLCNLARRKGNWKREFYSAWNESM